MAGSAKGKEPEDEMEALLGVILNGKGTKTKGISEA